MTEQLIQFIIYLLIGVGWIWGVHCLFQRGFIFYGKWREIDKSPDFILKPFLDCPPCMSSVHGTLIFFFSPMVHEFNLFLWPIYCICLCGINFILKEALYD